MRGQQKRKGARHAKYSEIEEIISRLGFPTIETAGLLDRKRDVFLICFFISGMSGAKRVIV